MKARNEAKHNSVGFRFFPFFGAPKGISGSKEHLLCPFLRKISNQLQIKQKNDLGTTTLRKESKNSVAYNDVNYSEV